jgi:hypothetical protein
MSARARAIAVVASALLTPLVSCSRPTIEKLPSDGSVVQMVGARNMFMGGVITPTPSSGEFLAIIELTPAKHKDAEKMCDLLRAGHPVSLRLREESDAPPILVSQVTDRGEAIIRCKTVEEAKHVIDRLHAWPTQ